MIYKCRFDIWKLYAYTNVYDHALISRLYELTMGMFG